MAANIYVASAFAAAMLLAGSGFAARAQSSLESPAGNTGAIKEVISVYEAALNASSADAVMPLYADDGVFMPPHNHAAVGKAAVREAYAAVFKAITLRLKFNVAEAVQMTPDWAFVRTSSAGAMTVNATGAQSTEGNQELFILKKGTDGSWKIARYSFSSTNPPPKQ
jgi:uncharacterized protein (TIGR02246 family)